MGAAEKDRPPEANLLIRPADRLLRPLEYLVKKPLFGCRMCGQCLLHATGLICPMQCPKNLRNGPCGGTGLEGHCEVFPDRRCAWHQAVERSARLPWANEIYQLNPPVDNTLKDTSAWVNYLTGRDHHHQISRPWQQLHLPDKGAVPERSGSRLERVLRRQQFAVITEVFPQEGVDQSALRQQVQELAGYVDACCLPDNGYATPHPGGLAAAALVEQAGVETVLHMTCRDRNRIILQADILGANILGIKNILCLTGDYTTLGDHPQAKPVFDLDSLNLIATIRKMRDEGTYLSGRPLASPPRVFIGGAVAPFAPPLEFRIQRLAKKIAAGVDFVISQQIFDVNLFAQYMRRVCDLGLHEKVHIIASVGALSGPERAYWNIANIPGVIIPEGLIRRLERAPKSQRKQEGINVCVEMIQQLREMPGVAGVDVMVNEPDKWIPTIEVIERAGLRPVPVIEKEALEKEDRYEN